jgi:uncharacterized protein (TIGR00290 family)
MQKNGPFHERDANNVVVSWTGGKDGCLACQRAMAEGYRVTHLLHFRNLGKTGSHELNPEVVRAQSESMGIPLVQRDFYSYEREFKEVVSELRAQGARIDGAVFGHIETHGSLVRRICRELAIDLLLPLWKQDPKRIISDLIESGFEIIIVSVRDGLMGEEWLGRRIDEAFIDDLAVYNDSIDPCGENGEFHTMVTDGPLFDTKIRITESDRILKDGYWFLEMRDVELLPK